MSNMRSHANVLLVDDEPDITTVLSMGLEDYGFKVDSYNDPLIALSHFKKSSYDIVILDIKMPKMDGFELYREIRKLDGKVNVFFTTAFDLQLEEFKDRINLPSLSHSLSLAAENNYNSYLKYFIKKPIEIDDFAKRINEELPS